MKYILFDEETVGMKFDVLDVPQEYAEKALEARQHMIESICELDDELLERYLEGDTDIPPDEIHRALRKGTLDLKATPVLMGTAFKNKGIQQLLDAVVDFLPSPLDVPPVEGKDSKGRTVLQTG